MPIVWILIAVQAVLAVRVLTRMLRSARGVTILPDAGADVAAGSVSIVVPVLDEVGRLGPCLEREREGLGVGDGPGGVVAGHALDRYG